IQLLADSHGHCIHLGERDCSVQRRHQKLVEIAPAPGLPDALRERLAADAVRIASEAGLTGLATVEFLVDADALAAGRSGDAHVFMEVNPRLQVEHTVTEEVLGLDLVALQLRVADGATLADLGVAGGVAPRGAAVQARVNAEAIAPGGAVTPTAGTVTALALPGGPGVRVDTHAEAGMEVSGRYDTLLAKVIAHAPGGTADAAVRLSAALAELRVDGVATNAALLRALLEQPEVARGEATTTLLDERLPALLERAGALAAGSGTGRGSAAADTAPAPTTGDVQEAEGQLVVRAPMLGTVARVPVLAGDTVAADAPLVLIEAMKMEHVVAAGSAGTVRRILVRPGQEVGAGAPLAVVEPAGAGVAATAAQVAVDPDAERPELAESRRRHWLLTDEARPEAVAKRHALGRRTARENLDDLVEPGSFVEYGGLAVAAQRARRDLGDLIQSTPADGLIGGVGRVNAELFPDDRAQAVVLSYDYMVLAGTQGVFGHRKKDRLFELTERLRRPVVFFTEGGGGRPGDTDQAMVAGLDTVAFALWAKLSGVVPRIGVASGRCFAGNAALYGMCDVTIATREASIGMGGPAMIEGGGLGVVDPDDVGPLSVQVPNGVVDIAVDDDAAAVAMAKRVLSYFQGAVTAWEAGDQRLLRTLVPEDRKRAYRVRPVIDALCDAGSVTELREAFGPGMVTALARLEGRPVGIVANDPVHMAGAITSDGADKAARFLQLCEAFGLPVLFLCDTPGIMVGPEAEATGLVRHAARLFLAGGALTVPFVTVVLRKGYGLGAQAMAGGSFRSPLATLSWPTGEFGGMGLEGAVKLALRKELAAIEDPAERQAAFDNAVAWAYEQGKATSMATYFEIDDVIDPADTRHVVLQLLRSAPPHASPDASHARRPRYVDAF
ncbi:MAG TPA: carboxyl transferase domain-containing protein, partial [Egibacteraceae bacterium]|nr:carboxyl transferase domain-containing protein [Egibacteraceae bacterium]